MPATVKYKSFSYNIAPTEYINILMTHEPLQYREEPLLIKLNSLNLKRL